MKLTKKKMIDMVKERIRQIRARNIASETDDILYLNNLIIKITHLRNDQIHDFAVQHNFYNQ